MVDHRGPFGWTYGSEGWGFESLRVRQPYPLPEPLWPTGRKPARRVC